MYSPVNSTILLNNPLNLSISAVAPFNILSLSHSPLYLDHLAIASPLGALFKGPPSLDGKLAGQKSVKENFQALPRLFVVNRSLLKLSRSLSARCRRFGIGGGGGGGGGVPHDSPAVVNPPRVDSCSHPLYPPLSNQFEITLRSFQCVQSKLQFKSSRLSARHSSTVNIHRQRAPAAALRTLQQPPASEFPCSPPPALCAPLELEIPKIVPHQPPPPLPHNQPPPTNSPYIPTCRCPTLTALELRRGCEMVYKKFTHPFTRSCITNMFFFCSRKTFFSEK